MIYFKRSSEFQRRFSIMAPLSIISIFILIPSCLANMCDDHTDTFSCSLKLDVSILPTCTVMCNPSCPFQVGLKQINKTSIVISSRSSENCTRRLQEIKIKCGDCHFVRICDPCFIETGVYVSAARSQPQNAKATDRKTPTSGSHQQTVSSSHRTTRDSKNVPLHGLPSLRGRDNGGYENTSKEVAGSIECESAGALNELKTSIPILIDFTDATTANNTLRLLSNISAISPEKMRAVEKFGEFFLSAIHSLTLHLSKVIDTQVSRFVTDRLALGFFKISEKNKPITFFVPDGGSVCSAQFSSDNNKPTKKMLASITVRCSKVKEQQIQFFLMSSSSLNVFKSMQLKKNKSEDFLHEVLSPVIAAEAPPNHTACQWPVSLSFSHDASKPKALRCASWNFTDSSWEDRWCKVIARTKDQIRCKCKRFANYALITKNGSTANIQTLVNDLMKMTTNSECNTKEETAKVVDELNDLRDLIDSNTESLPLLLPNVTKVLSNVLATQTDVMAQVAIFGNTILSSINSYSRLIPITDNGTWSASERLALGTISSKSTAHVTFYGTQNQTVRNARIIKGYPKTPVPLFISINTSEVEGSRMDFSLLSNSRLFAAMMKGSSVHNDVTSHVISPVIAARAQLRKSINQSAYPVQLMFSHTVSESGLLQCVFWNNNTNSWDSTGCRVIDKSPSRVQCECSHLTNFALLFTRQAKRLPYLEVLTYLSLGISCVALLLTIAANSMYLRHLLRFRRSQANQHKPSIRACCILLSLCVSLLGGHLVFLMGGNYRSSDTTCKVIGVLLHFFYLSVFSWSLIEGLNIFISFAFVVFSKDRLSVNISHFFLKASIFGWGAPAVIVILTLAIHGSNNYGLTVEGIEYSKQGICFLKDVPFYVAFFGPYLLCLVCNVVILSLLVVALRRHDSSALRSNAVNWKRRAFGFLGVCVVLNITWILGAVKIVVDDEVLMILFVLINGLQGLFIFLFYCLLKVEVRKLVLDMCCAPEKQTTASKDILEGSIDNILSASTCQTNVELEDSRKRHNGFYRGQFQGEIPVANQVVDDISTAND